MKINYAKFLLSISALVTVPRITHAQQLVTQTFTNPTQIQTFTLPATCSGVTIQAVGASGGSISACGGLPGGLGANMKGVFTFTPGTVLRILAGQMGSSSGGDGGGGGGSFVALQQGTVPLIVAGGGGGSSSSLANCTASLVMGMDASLTTTATAARNGNVTPATNGSGGQLGGNTSTSGGAGGGFYTDGAFGANPTGGGKAFVNGGDGGTPNTVSSAGGFGGGGCSWSTGGGGGGGGGYSGGATWQISPYCGGGGGGSFNSGTNQVNALATTPGNGYVTISYIVGTPINASASSNTICEGESVNLSVAGTGIVTYTWSTGANQANISVSPTTDSSFVIATTNTASCISLDTVYITVNPLPVIVSTTTPALLCVGYSATMTVNGASSYTWSGGPESNEYIVSPVVSTIYTVSGTSPEGCVSDKTVAVNVNSNTMGISPNSTICAGTSVTLTATGANSYLWNTTPQSPFNPQVQTPSVTTTYIATGVDQFGCTISNTVVVTVEPKPTIGLTANDNTACTGDKIVLTATGGSTYVFGSPVGGSGNTGTVVPVINLATTYSVIGTSPAGCTNTAQVTIQVSKCTGLGEQALSEAVVYPNPGNGLFTVEFTVLSPNSVLTVYDMSGKQVLSRNAEATNTVDLREQAPGIYVICISGNNGKRQLSRLIKE